MANIFWYCIPAVIGVGATVFTISKKREIELSAFLVFYLLATCVTWIGEFVVLGLFNSYSYKTGISPDTWANNILGHLLLNSTFYPGTAVLVAAFSLGYGWILLISVFYIIMEVLFLKLGIYEHHWWKCYMTGLTIFIYQVITKKWFNRMNNIRYGLWRISTFYFAGLVILHFPIALLLLSGKQYYRVNWSQDLYLSSTMFNFSYQLLETLSLVVFVCVLKRWFWKLVPFIIALIVQSTLAYFNILVCKNGWNLSYTLLVYFISIITFILLEKYSLKPNPPHPG